MPATTMTLREAAEELGVHYMTAYRYVRLGILPAHKDGATWQVAAEDIEAFRSRKTPGSGEGVGPRGARWEERIEGRLLAGDERGAWGVVEAALAAGMEPATVYTELVTPAMRSIGSEWHAGNLDIATEHRATGIVTRILARLSPLMARRGRTRGTVLVGGISGEHHSLPVTMVADLVRPAGYDVMDLGADLPVESLVVAAREAQRLIAIGLSVTTGGRDQATRDAVAAIHASLPGVPVIIGGGAITGPEHASSIGADYYAVNPPAVVALLEEITGSGPGGRAQPS